MGDTRYYSYSYNSSHEQKHLFLSAMKIRNNEFYHLIFWSGSINDPRLRLTTCIASENAAVVDFYNTLVFDTKWNTIYCCPSAENCEVNR